MPVQPIVRLGHPSLRTPAKPVPLPRIGRAEIQQLIDEMIETMRAAPGVGLAAPQLGVELQVFVYESAGNPDRGPEIPLRVVINPMITPHSGELVYDWEGCLSIPDLRGLVPRHPAVRVRALDREGQPLDYVAHGFEARIVQHEFDHLNGVVFLDRMRDLHSLAYLEEWEQYVNPEDEDTAVG
ncbi:MAG TPA: peptide deformylase [Thermoanaerobaculia bacterium]|nr:peptide deformylase [Thermoanaerobaculia bacterium]